MSGVIAFCRGCKAGIPFVKDSQNLLMRCCVLSFRKARAMATRQNKRTSRAVAGKTDSRKEDVWDNVLDNVTVGRAVKREVPVTEDLFQPVVILPKKTEGIDIGAELTGGAIKKDDLLKVLRDFYSQSKTQLLAAEHGLDISIFRKSFESFRRYCIETEQLPVEFHIVLSDILAGAGHVDDIFPYFLQHARQVFPHLECIEELRHISDLTEPVNWYPQARKIERKIIYHVGPTNSGKTYHALQRFFTSKSGVYCGPLRMLAVEVFNKCNEAETPCDLVTGEDRRQADPDGPAEHVACTVEMTSLTNHYEVAIIDEIQMLRDLTRGWAWTRALLGLSADEIHVCGEGSALDIVQTMVENCGDEFEVRKYDRLTKLTVLDEAVGSLKNIRPGDCIVCFSKNDIYSVTQRLESLGHQCAVIYGGLPPGTKYAQAEKFNDPDDSCNILVATDAIGMGLNLSIKRIIFFSIVKPTTDKDGAKHMERITTSQALQIAGRAGRFGTQYEDGEVTTFNKEDLPVLKNILAGIVEPVEQVGLHPTAEQIELFAYHLPKATLSNLIDIFIHLCRVDHETYFMCNMEDFKFLANMIEHIPLPLRVRYVLCCAPISSQQLFVCNMFLKFARQYSTGLPITYDWLMEKMKAPFRPPKTLPELVHLEQACDVFDLYLWLGYRFPDMFPDMEFVRESQAELDYVIQGSVAAITALLKGQAPKVKPAITIATEKVYGKMKRSSKQSKTEPLNYKMSEESVKTEMAGEAIERKTTKDGSNRKLSKMSFQKNIDEIESQEMMKEKSTGVASSPLNMFGLVRNEEGTDDKVFKNINVDNGEAQLKKTSADSEELSQRINGGENNDFNGHYNNNADQVRTVADQIENTISKMEITAETQEALKRAYQKKGNRLPLSRIPQAKQPFIKTEGIDKKQVPAGELLPRKSRRRRLDNLGTMNLSDFIQSVGPQEGEVGHAELDQDVPFGEGTLARKLTKKGLITKEMLAQLHREWLEAQESTGSESDDNQRNNLNGDLSNTNSNISNDSGKEKS